jgi:hypothetical protein
MLFHISLPVRQPETVARGFAELWRGHAAAFPVHPGGWMAFALDARNTAIELIPYGVAFSPEGHVQSAAARGAPGVHAAVATPLEEAEVMAIAARLGWPAARRTRAGFDVVEVWVEGDQMMELLTPEMQAQYLAVSVEGVCEAFGQPAPARARAPEPA